MTHSIFSDTNLNLLDEGKTLLNFLRNNRNNQLVSFKRKKRIPATNGMANFLKKAFF